MHTLLILLLSLALIGAFSFINHFRGGGGLFGLSDFTESLPGRPLYYATLAATIIAIPILAGSSVTYPVALLAEWISPSLPVWVLYAAMLAPAWLIFALPGLTFGLSYFMWGIWAWGRWQGLSYSPRERAHSASFFERIIEAISGPSNYIAYTLRNLLGFVTSGIMLTPIYLIMVPLQTLAYEIAWRLAKGKSGISRGELIFGGCWGGSLALLSWGEELYHYLLSFGTALLQ